MWLRITRMRSWQFTKMTKPLCFLFLFMLAICSQATSYYVDYVAGSDANPGTLVSPFKYSPGDYDATSVSAAVSLLPGDIVLYKGGVTYVSKLGLRFTGIGLAAGSPIVFDSSGSSYGTGQAILTSTNADIQLFAFTNANNVIFTGGMITNVGGYREDDPIWGTTTPVGSPPRGGGLLFYRSTNLIVTNMTFSEIGQWTNAMPMSGANGISGVGVAFYGCSNVVMSTCEITRMGIGVQIKANLLSSHILITNNNIHNFVNWGIDVNPSSGGHTEYVEICYNRFHDTREFDSNRWEGDPAEGSPHNNKVFFRTSAITSTWTNNNIHHNWCYDDDINAIGGTSQFFVSEGPSVNIYCNVFSGRSSNGDIQLGWGKSGVTYQKVVIFNNTFNSSSRNIGSGVTTFNADVLIVANNSFRRLTSQRNIDTITLYTNALWGSAQSFSDYNTTYSDYAPIANYYAYFPNTYATLANWRTWMLQDSNSFQANPQYVYTSGLPSTWNLHPLASSPLLNAGTNLTSLVGSTILDFDGNLMPSSGAWPIGAYGATNSDVGPSATSGTVNSSGTTLTIGFSEVIYIGSGGSAGFTISSSGGAATLTYVSGSGSSSLIYAISRIIYLGETATASYTQPGNGFEDLDGNDIATFSNLSVVNNSTATAETFGQPFTLPLRFYKR